MDEDMIGKIFVEKFTEGTVKVTDIFEEDGEKMVQCDSTHSNVGLIMSIEKFLSDFELKNKPSEQKEDIQSLEELREELKLLNKRKRRLNSLIANHSDNKTLQQNHLNEPEVKFLVTCYNYLQNNEDQLLFEPDGLLVINYDRLGYSRKQFYSLCKSIFNKGIAQEKIIQNVKSYGTWNNLNIQVADKIIQVSSLFDDHYALSINKKGKKEN